MDDIYKYSLSKSYRLDERAIWQAICGPQDIKTKYLSIFFKSVSINPWDKDRIETAKRKLGARKHG